MWSHISTSLPRHLHGNLPCPVLVCSGDDQLCLPFCQLECCWAMQFPGFLPAPLVRWGQEPCLLLNRIVTQLPCLGCRDRQGSSISVSCLWIQIRQTCSMPTSLFYLTWFCRWLKPLVWITICALMVGTWSAKIWLRDVVSPSSPITTRFSVVKVHRFPVVLMGQNQSREPHKWPSAGALDGCYSLSFPNRRTISSENTSLWFFVIEGEG